MIMQEDIGYYVKRIMKVFIRFSWGYSLSRMSLKTDVDYKMKASLHLKELFGYLFFCIFYEIESIHINDLILL